MTIPAAARPRVGASRRVAALCVLAAFASAPQAAQDGALPVVVPPPAGALSGMLADGREIRRLPDPQIVTDRLALGAVDQGPGLPDAAVTDQGGMLLVLAGMLAWIVGRRRPA